MADALIKIVVDQLFNIMKDQFQELREAMGVEKEIRNLSSKLEMIREVLDDAEKKSLKEYVVKLWVERIKDFSYDADNVLDEWLTRTLTQQIQRSKDASCSSFLPSCFHFKRIVVQRDIALKIKELDSTLDRITEEKDQFNFVAVTHTSASHPDQESKRVTTTSFVDASEIQGRDNDASTVISKLMEDARNGPRVISIVGAGGIGKTTLAQLVYGDEQIKTHFHERVWICVSHPFDQIKIAKAIVESTTKSSTDLSERLQVLLEKIQSTLSEKRFLLILDDVWEEQYAKWEPLKNSLKGGHAGSRILVTSRSERVAKMMGTVETDLHKLDQISDSDSWLLLSRIAFSGRREEDCEKLKEIGQKIAQKCKGLPLAVKVMGSLLLYKDTEEEWQNVLDSKIWELEEVETEVFPQLYLSYDDLKPKMKRCFSYCAVFPKDYVIKVDKLIRIWMAQGYLTTTNGSDQNQMELKGRELFRNLAMRSFFQDLEKDDIDSKIKSCKMHDIVHDFAQFLTGNECCSIDRHEDTAENEIKNVRHLSWQETGRPMNPASICDIGKLRSFFAEGLSPEQLTPDLFNGLKSVRVLGLRGCELKELPKEIGNLLHLRYIDLSWSKVEELPDAICTLYNLQTLYLKRCRCLSRLPEGIGKLINLQTLDLERCECLSRLPEGVGNLLHLRYINLSRSKVKELPDAICSLYNLQTLDLRGCVWLSRLPEGIGKLINLRHLNIRDTHRLEMLPQGIAKLTQLRTLCKFVVGKELKLGDLEKLNQLQGELSIHFIGDLNNASDVEEAKKAELRNKKHLKELHLNFYGRVEVRIDVMEALKPPPELQSLTIEGYRGTHFPSWITLSLDNLRVLNIYACFCSSLPPLGKLPSLETLEIWDMKELKYVGSEFLGVPEVAVAFPKLKKLEFFCCFEWEEWEDLKQEAAIMPCIRELQLLYCDKLKTVPHHLLSRMSPLESLKIKKCPCLKVDYSEVRIDVMGALKLESLIIEGYSGTHFPSWITLSLDNLRVLEIKECYNCSSLPPLGKLPSLETLSIENMKELKYVGSEFLGVPEVAVAFPKLKILTFLDCYEWEEWEDFKQEAAIMPCIRELQLVGCFKLKTVPHHLLSRMSPLESLYIRDCSLLQVDFSEVRIDVMGALKLESLIIEGYSGTHFPSWITLSLDNLRFLRLWRCYNCSSLPPLGKLPSLETLEIWHMKELKYVGSEFLGVPEVAVAFPKLKKLEFWDCYEWEEWEDFKQEAAIMPCFRELQLVECRKLKTVPHHLLSRMPPLESLKITLCPCLKVDKSEILSHIPHADLDYMSE